MITGLSSSFDQVVEQYEAIQRQPIDKLELEKQQVQKKKSTFDELRTKTKELKDLAQKFSRTGALSEFGAKAVTTSNDTIVSASANATAIDGSHTLVVSQLAKNDGLITDQFTRTGTELLTAEGAGTKTFDITVNGTTTSVSVVLDGSEDNKTALEKVTNAVNGASGIKVNASIVNDTGTSNRMVLTSKDTGLDNKITFADTSGTLLASIGFTTALSSGTSGGRLYNDTDLDAKFTLDGIAIESSSNSVSDAITGVSLELKSADASKTVTLGIKTDTDGLKTKVNEFLEKFNGVIDYINASSFVDKETYLRGPLANDTAYRSLKSQLRAFVVKSITGLEAGSPTTLFELGVKSERDGRLILSDNDKFKKVAEADPKNISNLFNSTNGLGKQIEDYLLEYTKTGGVIDRSKDTVETRVRNINKRIKTYEARIQIRIEAYRRQFAQLQEAMSRVQAQQTSLNTVLSAYGGGY